MGQVSGLFPDSLWEGVKSCGGHALGAYLEGFGREENCEGQIGGTRLSGSRFGCGTGGRLKLRQPSVLPSTGDILECPEEIEPVEPGHQKCVFTGGSLSPEGLSSGTS